MDHLIQQRTSAGMTDVVCLPPMLQQTQSHFNLSADVAAWQPSQPFKKAPSVASSHPLLAHGRGAVHRPTLPNTGSAVSPELGVTALFLVRHGKPIKKPSGQPLSCET